MACGSIHPQTRTSIFPQLLPSMLDTLNPIYSLSLWWKGCAKYFEAHPRWHKKSIWRQKRGGVDRSQARGGTEPSQIAPHANLWSQAGPPSQDIRNYQGPSFLKWGHFKKDSTRSNEISGFLFSFPAKELCTKYEKDWAVAKVERVTFWAKVFFATLDNSCSD